MMLRKLLANKKIVIVAIAILLALIVGIVILVTSNTKEGGNKNLGTKTEQNKGDTDSQDDKDDKDDKDETDADDKANNQGNGSTELEVLEPDEVVPEDYSDASGSWGDTPDSNTQTGNPGTTDKEDDGGDPEKEENILEDDITWGDVY